MSTVARRIVVGGAVQGVNYRSWVRERALAHDLHGWAANLPDGSVEVWLQGEPGGVAAVEAALAQGPSHARVARVAGDDVAPRDDLGGAFARR